MQSHGLKTHVSEIRIRASKNDEMGKQLYVDTGPDPQLVQIGLSLLKSVELYQRSDL